VAAPKSSSNRGRKSSRSRSSGGAKPKRASDGLASLGEQLANRILRPLDLVVLSRERIQETLDEAAERGRVTRTDANELAALLMQRGRQQTDELLADLERLLGRGRQQLDTTALKARRSRPVDRLVRGADRARRKVGVGPAFPILGYDELTVDQAKPRLGRLNRAELRKVREYERRHGKRKSVLTAIDKLLS
jgi:polyhydroxyalkanoate synthesis regulator phasin